MIRVHDRGYDVTAVAFSGLAPRCEMFEWCKSFNDLPCNFVGIIDPENKWYQGALEKYAAEVEGAIPRKQRRLFIGGSAGGFAALLYARKLKADGCIAFSPQSACGADKRRLGDYRWPEFCESTPACDIAGGHDAIIHYAEDDELDDMHAERLVCRHWRHPVGGHNVAQELKRAGKLGDIIANELKAIA